VIPGGRDHLYVLGKVTVVPAPESSPPFRVDAVAVEDDTYSVLSADPGFHIPTEHAIRIWTEAHETTPAAPGSVSTRPGDPLKLLAVVHDLSLDPTWREEWVAGALQEILRYAGRLELSNLALPILGSVHGKLLPDRFVKILAYAVEQAALDSAIRVWLITPAGKRRQVEGALHGCSFE